MPEDVVSVQESEGPVQSSSGKLENLKTLFKESIKSGGIPGHFASLQEVLSLLEDQLYKFEGDLLTNAFYGSILNGGWNRAALSIVPSRAQPSVLKRNFQEDERIFSRSSVEFMKRRRREAVDQENRSHAVPGRQQRLNASVNKDVNGETKKRLGDVVIKTEPRSPSPEIKRSKIRQT
ncbi:histone acetyltransferase subunit NuA4 [Cooperia oncophora]